MTHERRVVAIAIGAGLPATMIALALLWTEDHSAKVRWTFALFIAIGWLVGGVMLHERVVRPLQTLSNMLAALREGDSSIRARFAQREDALGLAFLEANLLSETLRSQRLGAMEATTLLHTVMAEIDVAIFTFGPDARLRLVNRAGARLLAQPEERLLGRTAEQLELDDLLHRNAPQRVDTTFPGGSGRWEVRRTSFRQDGLPHTLLVVSDLTRTLREEELLAWQRLVRVLGHEINNSLAPIKSIADSLSGLLKRQPRPADLDEDLSTGLNVVGGRAESLSRFMASYALLARLPAPRVAPVEVGELARRVAALEQRVPVTVIAGPATIIEADADQLEQLLINLVRNAADASLETGGGVRLGWTRRDGQIELRVEDDGLGLASTANLFVPFFTTKPKGSGIGLVLSRQIAEAHQGTLTLENRRDGRGCEARLRLPISVERGA
jgi:nitrogen fixation/metabolism regulation signal transduction histidine kinase